MERVADRYDAMVAAVRDDVGVNSFGVGVVARITSSIHLPGRYRAVGVPT